MGKDSLCNYDCDHEKTIISLNDATVTPTTVNRDSKTFTGCVYDALGEIVTASHRTNRNVEWKPADPLFISSDFSADAVEGECIYLGHYTGHYGHFLLETLSRFWALKKNKSFNKYVFHPFVHSVPDPQVFSPAKVCFDCFGISAENVLLIHRRMKFRNLIVPTSLFEIFNSADEELARVYEQITDYCLSVYTNGSMRMKGGDSCQQLRLYLSRKKHKGARCIANENEVERLFVSLGFRILYPERMDFDEQVALYRQAEVIAGFQGSAMHNTVFMKKNALAIIIGDLMAPLHANRNQDICNFLSKVNSVYISFNGSVVNQDANAGAIDLAYLRNEIQCVI